VQNRPNPGVPVKERRWLDRLRAAWDELRTSPQDRTRAEALETVAQERPQEARYRIDTFAADAEQRTRSEPAKMHEERVEDEPGPSRRRRGIATSETDRFDDEAGQ
jgi:hypothetical protein